MQTDVLLERSVPFLGLGFCLKGFNRILLPQFVPSQVHKRATT